MATKLHPGQMLLFDLHPLPVEPPPTPSVAASPPMPQSAVAVAAESDASAKDLDRLYAWLNRAYFQDEVETEVAWGRHSQRRRRRRRVRRQTIRLGSYDYERNLIRIHPLLAHPRVPAFVVEAVLHHEMVHAALPVIVRNGRRRYHTRTFRALERRYHRQREADAWIAEHLDWLLKARFD